MQISGQRPAPVDLELLSQIEEFYELTEDRRQSDTNCYVPSRYITSITQEFFSTWMREKGKAEEQVKEKEQGEVRGLVTDWSIDNHTQLRRQLFKH